MLAKSGYPGRWLDTAQIALDQIEPTPRVDAALTFKSTCAQHGGAAFAQFPEGVGKSRPPVGAPIADVSLTAGAGGASSPPRTGVISVTDAMVAGRAGWKACWPAPKT